MVMTLRTCMIINYDTWFIQPKFQSIHVIVFFISDANNYEKQIGNSTTTLLSTQYYY